MKSVACWVGGFVAGMATLQAVPTITLQPGDQSAMEGVSVEMSVHASGGKELKYQWLRDGISLPGETSSTLTIAHAKPEIAGDFSVVVTDESGSSISRTAKLAVSPTTAQSFSTRNSTALDFDTQEGSLYQVMVKTTETGWTPLGGPLEGTGGLVTVLYPADSAGAEFRVETMPSASGASSRKLEFKLTGIYRVAGKPRACVAQIDKGEDPPKKQFIRLAEGERLGEVRMQKIDPTKGAVSLEINGHPLSLTFAGNSFQTTQSAPPPKATPGRPAVFKAPPKPRAFMANIKPPKKRLPRPDRYRRYSFSHVPRWTSWHPRISRRIRLMPAPITFSSFHVHTWNARRSANRSPKRQSLPPRPPGYRAKK